MKIPTYASDILKNQSMKMFMMLPEVVIILDLKFNHQSMNLVTISEIFMFKMVFSSSYRAKAIKQLAHT